METDPIRMCELLVGLPEVRVGMMAVQGGVQRLPRQIPYHLAMGMLLTGQRLTAQAEVIRRHPREDAHTELSIRFIGLGERREDAIRRYVFAEMRDLRTRGLI